MPQTQVFSLLLSKVYALVALQKLIKPSSFIYDTSRLGAKSQPRLAEQGVIFITYRIAKPLSAGWGRSVIPMLVPLATAGADSPMRRVMVPCWAAYRQRPFSSSGCPSRNRALGHGPKVAHAHKGPGYGVDLGEDGGLLNLDGAVASRHISGLTRSGSPAKLSQIGPHTVYAVRRATFL